VGVVLSCYWQNTTNVVLSGNKSTGSTGSTFLNHLIFMIPFRTNSLLLLDKSTRFVFVESFLLVVHIVRRRVQRSASLEKGECPIAVPSYGIQFFVLLTG
jgi:uncharacterized membrane protein